MGHYCMYALHTVDARVCGDAWIFSHFGHSRCNSVILVRLCMERVLVISAVLSVYMEAGEMKNSL